MIIGEILSEIFEALAEAILDALPTKIAVMILFLLFIGFMCLLAFG